MSLLDDILTWATAELTLWQRDALRRLFQKQGLDAQDYNDLYAMLKSSHQLPDPQNLQPIPLAQNHLPVHSGNTTPVILRRMRELKHVNRIAPGQVLEFAPKGLTVIYGGNGSGKSGYSRVLKRACRARDSSETVHPDAFDPTVAKNTPEAVFDVELAAKSHSLVWKLTISSPDELSSLAVFDARCARAYLDTEQEAAYLPYGLDIVENLAQKVLPELSRRLNAEIAAINTDPTPFADLQGETVVGKLLASLSAKSDTRKFNELAKLTTEDIERLDQLEKTLAEPDPKSKATSLRISARRVDGLVERVGAATSTVDDAAIEKLKAVNNESIAASHAEAVAATNFRAGEKLLAGTGEPVWRNLFEAARRFSVELAYPNKPFPNAETGTQCPLCQQPLDNVAAERMQRFDDFINQEAGKIAAEKRRQLEDAVNELKVASLGFGLDAATTAEIDQLAPQHLLVIQKFEKQVEDRRAWMLGAIHTQAWDQVPPLACDPREGLKSVSIKLITEAKDLDKAGDENEKKTLTIECAELRARATLAPRVQAIVDLIERLRLKDSLTNCRDDLKSKGISDKARDFANKAVTSALKNALDTEFKALGVGHIRTKLNSRVEQGKVRHKLVLDLPLTKKLDEILSEGEQRAIAIGSFLAEMHLANHLGGIAFDDPVSSLDHYRRKDVARRLVKEAKARQVIIFTHDTVFLGELRDVLEQEKVDNLIHHLDWVNGYPGRVNDGLPWDHKSYMDRIDKHEKSQRLLAKTWPVYPNSDESSKMRHEYDLLRSTIERAIQDLVFNGVVQRYRDWIRVDRLDGVAGVTDTDYKTIARLHKACCVVVDSHDPASAKNSPVPSATQLGQDIAELKSVIENIKSARKSAVSN